MLEAKIVQEMDMNSTKLDSEADRIVNATFKDQARSVLQDLSKTTHPESCGNSNKNILNSNPHHKEIY